MALFARLGKAFMIALKNALHDACGVESQPSGSQQRVYGFTGEETDGGGLVYLRVRYYNAAIGQFFNLDPLEGNIRGAQRIVTYGPIARRPSGFTIMNYTEVPYTIFVAIQQEV